MFGDPKDFSLFKIKFHMLDLKAGDAALSGRISVLDAFPFERFIYVI